MMKKYQQGLSLIELMVAMTLGLVLLAGVVQIFFSTKQSYSIQIGQSQVLDSGRIAMHFLGDSLRKSGHWAGEAMTPAYDSDETLTVGTYTGRFEAAQFVEGINNTAAGDTVEDGTDQVFVRFAGDDDNPMANCLGTTLTASQMAVERYYLREPTGTEDLPSLVCETSVMNVDQVDGTLTVPAGAVTTTQPLVTGVENLQIVYGHVNNNGDQMQYYDAASVPDWTRVVSIRMALLAASSDFSANGINYTTGFDLLGEAVPIPTDTRSRRVFEHLVALRNTNP